MKPLDIVKIMMGVYSERANIKRFMNDGLYWAKY
jgi:sugar phosphate permease